MDTVAWEAQVARQDPIRRESFEPREAPCDCRIYSGATVVDRILTNRTSSQYVFGKLVVISASLEFR